MNNGKQGEYLFQKKMSGQGYIVQNVSENRNYFDKDIDFVITNPATGNIRTFEVKWDERINSTGNLFLELENPRSKQWNGQGWWLHCKADYLIYGDAIAKKFYSVPLLELRQRVDLIQHLLCQKRTKDYALGMLLPLEKIADIAIELE